MYQKILTVRELLGINNVLPPERIPPGEKAFLTEAQNLDIDDSFKGTTRGGYADPVYRGSNLHSFFSYLDTALFIEGADLKKLNPDYSSTIIRTGAGTDRMSYVGVQDRIYFTNGSIIEYFDRKDGQVHQFVDPGITYKSVMRPGHLIEWYNGRLYVASGGDVWVSDPAAPHRTDIRKNFRSLGGYITLLRGVLDGLYVSNGRQTFFWAGGDFTDMQNIRVDEHPAIAGTDVRVDGEFVGKKGFPNWVIVWLTVTGITIGAPQGKVIKFTKDFYRPDLESPGSAMVRRIVSAATPNQQFYQYLVSQQTAADVIVNAGGAPLTAAPSLGAELAAE